MISLQDSTFIICSIVRDAEEGLRRNIPVVNEFCKYVKDYHIIVYENDSLDSTKSILTEWSNTDLDRIHISLNTTDPSKTIPSKQSVGNYNPFFSRKRIDKMANLRNYYMDYIEKNKMVADYLIVVDLDVAQLDCSSILSSFEVDFEWDAVTAFGYSTSPKFRRRYHDTYALSEWGDQDNPQTEEKIKKFADKYGLLQSTDDWVRIASGFGGLSIYRFESVCGLKYAVYDNDNDRVEVKCEHFSIYKQMIDRGYDRIYINPAMTLKYQKLTFSIIWNSLLRMIGF